MDIIVHAFFSSGDHNKLMIDQNWSRKDPATEARDRNVKGTLESLLY